MLSYQVRIKKTLEILNVLKKAKMAPMIGGTYKSIKKLVLNVEIRL